jgi:Toastrack DUF4097
MSRLLTCIAIAALTAPLAIPQQRETVAFNDPSRPGKIVVQAMAGSVTVKAYEGKEAIIESTGNAPGPYHRTEPVPPGMHRIGGSTGGLEITQSNNTITVSPGASGFLYNQDVTIQVPAQTSVTVNAVAAKSMVIEGISGEIEAGNTSGGISIVNCSGPVMAHSMNGKIEASLTSVPPDKAMSFSTFNGDIDVTLPASTKADLTVRTDRGDIFTDFDVNLDSNVPPEANGQAKVKAKAKAGGNRRYFAASAAHGTINGGGPEMQFTTYNGTILIHKK